MVALGMTNQQIADERGTTIRAVSNVLARTIAVIDATDSPDGSGPVTAAREFIRGGPAQRPLNSRRRRRRRSLGGAEGIRTPDPLHAMQRRTVRGRPSTSDFP